MSKLVRLSPDKTKGVVQEDDVFSVLNFDLKTVESVVDTLPEGEWETPSTEERLSVLPLVAAMGDERRSRRVENQPRDLQGRWVAAGANVRWNSNGEDWAGTVMAIKDGKAIVQVKHEDGTESQTTLMPNTLRVLATKARLSSAKKKEFKDDNNNTKDFVEKNKSEVEKAASEGGAKIDRKDGYSVDALKKPVDRDGDGVAGEKEKAMEEAEKGVKAKEKDKSEEKSGDKSKTPTSNALMYQLYAPNGKSLGIFEGAGSIDQVISSDQGAANGSVGGQKTAINGDVVIVSSASSIYTVPKNVQDSIKNFIDKSGETLSDEMLFSASKLCSGSQVSYDDLEYAREYYESLEDTIDLYGGYAGNKWISKIEQTKDEPTVAAHNFFDSVYSYYVYGNRDSSFVGLIAVDFLKGSVLGWTGTDFGLELGPIENFDADIIEYVDDYTAEEVSKFLGGSKETSFSLMDVFPDERNLFALAHSEIDFQLLDDVAQFSYESGDRSLDAQKQARDGGGKFGKVNPMPENVPSVDSSTKYFAIVDEVDTTAVMDIVAIVNKDGVPQLFKRLMNQWVPDEELLQDIEGATPPPVSLLTTPEAVKEVLAQVDLYDSGKDESVTASGFSLPDGSLSIFSDNDLYLAVYAVTESPTTEGILHTVKRAKALNRIDVVPEDWRIFAANTVGSQDLYGEFGEVLTASASPVEMSNLERLESYWLNNDKIDWSSDYAVEYATPMLSKYLGTSRGEAFATILKNKAGNL